MSSQVAGTTREAAIWARLIETQQELTPEAAKYILSIGFGESDRKRMAELAERSSLGMLTDEDQAELDSYLHIGNLLAVMQSRARVVLGQRPAKAPAS